MCLPTCGWSISHATPAASQFLAGADAGKHQQVGRTDRARADDDFLVRIDRAGFARGVAIFHALRGQPVEDDTRGVGAGDDFQVRPALGLARDKRVICARSLAVPRGGLEQRGHRRPASVASIVVAACKSRGL